MSAAILGFLKALPLMVSELKELRVAISKMNEMRIEYKFQKIENELNELSKKVKDETDKKKLLDLATAINDARKL